MGKPSPEETIRNSQLLKEYNSGVKMIDLVIKYHISSTRIYQIIKRAKNKNA